MAEVTQEMIDNAINGCMWRQDMGAAVAFCRGMCLPCSRVIDNGTCEALIDLFKENKDGNDG